MSIHMTSKMHTLLLLAIEIALFNGVYSCSDSLTWGCDSDEVTDDYGSTDACDDVKVDEDAPADDSGTHSAPDDGLSWEEESSDEIADDDITDEERFSRWLHYAEDKKCKTFQECYREIVNCCLTAEEHLNELLWALYNETKEERYVDMVTCDSPLEQLTLDDALKFKNTNDVWDQTKYENLKKAIELYKKEHCKPERLENNKAMTVPEIHVDKKQPSNVNGNWYTRYNLRSGGKLAGALGVEVMRSGRACGDDETPEGYKTVEYILKGDCITIDKEHRNKGYMSILRAAEILHYERVLGKKFIHTIWAVGGHMAHFSHGFEVWGKKVNKWRANDMFWHRFEYKDDFGPRALNQVLVDMRKKYRRTKQKESLKEFLVAAEANGDVSGVPKDEVGEMVLQFHMIMDNPVQTWALKKQYALIQTGTPNTYDLKKANEVVAKVIID